MSVAFFADSSLHITLDGNKTTLILFDEEHRRLILRDHARPDEKIIGTVAALQVLHSTSPQAASLASVMKDGSHTSEAAALPPPISSSDQQDAHRKNVEDVLTTLVCQQLHVERLYLNMNSPLLSYVRDSRALEALLDALHQHFPLIARNALSPTQTVGDLVSLILTRETTTRDTASITFEEKEVHDEANG